VRRRSAQWSGVRLRGHPGRRLSEGRWGGDTRRAAAAVLVLGFNVRRSRWKLGVGDDGEDCGFYFSISEGSKCKEGRARMDEANDGPCMVD
jgi:hypothetical protein